MRKFWVSRGDSLSKENPVDCCVTLQLVLATLENLFLTLTWKLLNKSTTQTKKLSNWVAENLTEHIFFNKILRFMMSNVFSKSFSMSCILLGVTMTKNWIIHLKLSFLCLLCFIYCVQLSQRFKPGFFWW